MIVVEGVKIYKTCKKCIFGDEVLGIQWGESPYIKLKKGDIVCSILVKLNPDKCVLKCGKKLDNCPFKKIKDVKEYKIGGTD